MPYCTSDDVFRVTGLASSNGPVSAADVTLHIAAAQKEVDRRCQTKFLSVESSGTATSSTSTTLTDSAQSWTADEWNNNYMVYITGGTGSGQLRKITNNTTTQLTVDSAWDTNPDTDSTFEIYQNTIISETFDGNGFDYIFVNNYPLFKLQSLTIASTSITTTNVYTYNDVGKLKLKDSAEYSWFSDANPQDVSLTYAYGVYPMPDIIEEYTAILAGMRTLIEQIGGTYDDVTSYSLPELQASKGEPFTNIREAYMRLEKREQVLRPLLPYYAHFG